MVAPLNRVQAKRRPCEHEISGLQSLAETMEITAKPLERLRGTISHGPQGSSLHARAVDGNGQGAGVCPIFERGRLEMLRDDHAGVDAVIGDEFGKRLPWSPEYELVQLDDGKSRRDPTINPDPKRHLAFDRWIGVSPIAKGFAGTVNFTAKEPGMDRPAHTELFDYARADAADLISGQRVTSGATQASDLNLNFVGFIERQRYVRVSEHGSRRAPPVVAPLAAGQASQGCRI